MEVTDKTNSVTVDNDVKKKNDDDVKKTNDDDLNIDIDDLLPEHRVFTFRAEQIFKKQQEEYEEIRKEIIKENEEKERNEFMKNISEQLKKKKPRGRKCKYTLRGRKNKSNAEDDLQFLPPAARKRLKKLEVEALKDQKRIETLNSHALANCTTSDENLDDIIILDMPTEKDITLKISYICDVSKIAVDKNEQFSKIYPKVADMYKLKANEILLYLRDEVIHLNDTPKSRNIKCWDIIECLPYKPLDKKNIETDSNIISIKMQSNDIKKRIEMHAHKLEKFQDIMERYATLCNLPLKDLVFKFDGEQIDESDTPDALDMESGSCIDITILSLKSAPSTVSTHSENVQQIPEHEMLQICVLD